MSEAHARDLALRLWPEEKVHNFKVQISIEESRAQRREAYVRGYLAALAVPTLGEDAR